MGGAVMAGRGWLGCRCEIANCFSELLRLLDMAEVATVGETDQSRVRNKIVQNICPARAADEVMVANQDEGRFRQARQRPSNVERQIVADQKICSY